MTADHWWELHLQRWKLRQKRKTGKSGVPFFFGGGLPSKRDGDVGLCGLEGGPCWLVFWKLLSFFLAWCVFFPVWVYFVVRKTVKQIQASYVFFWHGFDSWWCEFSIHSIRWTEMSFKRMPSPPGKGKKWSNKKKDLTFEAPKPELFSWWGQFSQVSQGRGGVLGV